MADISNIKLGVCTVKFGDTELGHTKGGVVLTYEPSYHDLAVDAYGETVVDKRLLGEKITAKVPMAESTLDNLQIAMPMATTDGTTLKIGSSVGDSLAAEADTLVLHPVSNMYDNLDDDFTIHKAVVSNTIELPYTNDGEQIIEVEFTALLDETKDDGNYLGAFGDLT